MDGARLENQNRLPLVQNNGRGLGALKWLHASGNALNVGCCVDAVNYTAALLFTPTCTCQ